MDRHAGASDREDDVQDLIEDYGLDAATARLVVALARGEIDGDVDVAATATPEERRRSGGEFDPFDDPDDDRFP